MAHTASKNWTATFQQMTNTDGTKSLSYAWTIAGTAHAGTGLEGFGKNLNRSIPYDATRDAAIVAAIEAKLAEE